MALIPGQGVALTVELDPEGAPGEFTEFPGLSADLDTFENPLRAAMRAVRSAVAVPPSVLSMAYASAREYEEERARMEALGTGLSEASSAARLYSVSVQEFNRSLAALSRAFSPVQSNWAIVARKSEVRAEAFLRSLLTPGEQSCLESLKVVPVIGAETGDLWLVSRRASYNLLRYERVEAATLPTLYCASAGLPAPQADLTASLLLSLRGPERALIEVANRFHDIRSLPFTSLSPGETELALYPDLCALYPDLCALAQERCRDEKLLRGVLRRAKKLPPLA